MHCNGSGSGSGSDTKPQGPLQPPMTAAVTPSSNASLVRSIVSKCVNTSRACLPVTCISMSMDELLQLVSLGCTTQPAPSSSQLHIVGGVHVSIGASSSQQQAQQQQHQQLDLDDSLMALIAMQHVPPKRKYVGKCSWEKCNMPETSRRTRLQNGS